MPTGYTSELYDLKDQTFKDFALECSRAFGARVMERENSTKAGYVPREISDYAATSLVKDIADYNEAMSRTDEEWKSALLKAQLEYQRSRDDHLEAINAVEAKYRGMLAEVVAWEPPTEDHDGLKEFMIEQLESAIEFDCSPMTWGGSIMSMTVEDYKCDRLSSINRSIDYRVKDLEDEIKRARVSNLWVQDLIESL